MDYRIFDYKNYNSDDTLGENLNKDVFPDFYCLKDKLGLTWIGDPVLLNPMSNVIVFVHDTNRMNRWEVQASIERKVWIVFVSRGGPDGLWSDVKGVKCITQDLSVVISQIEYIPGLIKKFKDSCESKNGPDVTMLMGSWPKRVLARYILESLPHKEIELYSLGIDDKQVKNEFVQYAQSYGMDLQGDNDNVTLQLMRELLEKISNKQAGK